MNIKRYILILLSICAFTLSAFAYDCKIDGIYYDLDNVNKTATVTQKELGCPSYKGAIIIPNKITYKNSTYTVTSIQSGAFINCISLTSVEIPNTVTSIGKSAFSNCVKLTTINIPNSVSHIGYDAFGTCKSLETIEIPNSITSIENNVFAGCESLTSIIIPNTVTSIGDNAFGRSTLGFATCSSLKSISLPDSLTHIGNGAFYGCSNLTSIVIPNSVTFIGNNAFSCCSSLASINIPNSVTSIGSYAFDFCSSLASIVITNSVKKIGPYAFHCSGLTSVVIPGSVTSIGNNAFYCCRQLTTIVIPNSVSSIGDDVFGFCKSLKEIIVSPEYKYSIPGVNKDLVKRKIIENSIEEYLANRPFITWEKYYSTKTAKKRPKSNEDITRRISNEIEAWQKKGEFETTAQWNERVNEKTRSEKIDSLKHHYIGIAQREQDEYQQEIEALQKSYQVEYKQHYDSLSNHYITMLTQLKNDDFKKESFELNSPYDADHQSFLIKTSTYGDILLPVPISEAPSFKENWNTIKDKITPTFAFNGKDAVLSKLTFTNKGKDYIYDSHTEAKYAVADIDYNFAPLELEAIDFDLQNIDIKAPEIGQSDIAQTLSKKSDASALEKKKVDVGRQTITVGSGPTKPDVDATIPRVNRNADKTFALIIANENYRREGSVPYALNDGKILAEYFKSTIGIPQKNIQLYTDASLNDIKYGINKLKQICDAFGNQASVIVYYAGHGIPDEKSGNAHLLPVDGYGSDVSTGYALQDLYETLGNLPSRQTLLLLDACFSGSQRDGAMMASNARGIRIKAKSCTVKGNLIVLSATQGDETAYPYEEKQHGMFTYFLLKKLNENMGNVTLGDLADYVITNVKQTSILTNDKIQTPTVNVSPELSSNWKNLQIGQ